MNNENSTVFSKPEYSKKPPVNFKKKRIITLVLVIISVILVGGATLFALKLKTPEQKTTAETDNSVELTDFDEETLKSVLVKTNKNTIAFYSGEGQYSWFIKGVDPDLTNATDIYNLVAKVCNLTADKQLKAESTQNLGFSNPYLTLTVKTKNKRNNFALTAGNLTANEDSRYVKLSNSENIYIMSTDTIEEFNVNSLSFASTSVVSGAELSEKDETNQKISAYFDSGLLQYFDQCSASGGSMKYSLKIKHIKDQSYKMVSPYNKPINTESTIDLLSIIKYGLTADGVYSYNQNNLEKYGLNSPISLKIYAADNYSVKLNIGSLQSDGYYPVTASGRKPVFKVKADEFDFLFTDISEYFSKHIISDTVSEFSTVTVTGSGINSTFSFTKKDDSDTTPTTELNGKPLDFEQFRRFYKRVLGMASADLITGTETGGETVLNLKFEYSNLDLPAKTLTVKKYKTRKYLVEQNGSTVAIVTKTDVMNIINSATALQNGKEITDIDI